jgi:hypothetical protein
MRRDFRLPEEDEQYLGSLGLPWETVKEGDTCWLVIHNWPVPVGYNQSTVSAAVIIPPSYSDGQIDMVYFYPHLAISSGKAVNNLTPRAFEGREWQQWSRHRTPENPWRPGLDNLATHFLLVEYWLRRELPGVAA